MKNDKKLFIICLVLMSLAISSCAGVERTCGDGMGYGGAGFFFVDFSNLPDDSPVVADSAGPSRNPSGNFLALAGDEYEACGIIIGTEDQNPGGCIGIYPDYYLFQDSYFLATASTCHSKELVITFNDPVQEVTVWFFGADVGYFLFAYDEEGNELGWATEDGNFNMDTLTPVGLSFLSSSSNISQIRFSGPPYGANVITAIAEIVFYR